ncbi:hypothetical protein CDQ92_11935 [Sphingopyxis bauzanensis]|uniref:Uncharacterized protein n=1 Tax=Sphingopyxis bauzanensis TaxID=651663 RepID=A0A246JSL9_9SPHN|nr:hypothetical protein CDQ92_11935 [Sphingopyxis bauzanensis]
MRIAFGSIGANTGSITGRKPFIYRRTVSGRAISWRPTCTGRSRVAKSAYGDEIIFLRESA